MPDENGTEATRENAQSAAESLFGDTPADQTVAVAKEEDSKNETEQDSQGSDVGEDQTAEGEASPTEDLKVVVSIKDGRATIGVQQPSSDPHIEPVDAPDLSGLVREVPAVVERAAAKWGDAPRFPAHERPAPPPKRRTRRRQESEQASTTEEEGQPQPEALRLF